jgi:hypothetical protein
MNGRAVAVRKLHAGDALGKVHLLFIGDDDLPDSEKALAARVLSRSSGRRQARA